MNIYIHSKELLLFQFKYILNLLSLIDGNTDEYFAINEMSGELSTTRALDREEVSNFTLLILCSDLGSPPQSSTAQLQVRVLDDNDHSPSFPRLQYQASVREDAQVGTTVLVLSSADEDEGLNGQTMYSLVHGTPLQYSCLENPMGGGAW